MSEIGQGAGAVPNALPDKRGLGWVFIRQNRGAKTRMTALPCQGRLFSADRLFGKHFHGVA